MQKLLKPNANLKQTFVALLLWVIVISSLTGCDKSAEGVELAKAGQSTAETMANYYESLIQDTYDTWDYESFLIGKDKQPGEQLPPSVSGADLYTKRIEELNKRVKLAKNLASTYEALQELSSYDASGEVSKSVGELADSIGGLGVFPKAAINPTSLFQMAAKDLIDWKKSKDIRKGSALILQVLQRLYDLFDKESRAYKSIVNEKGEQVTILMEYLIGKEKVTSLGLLQRVPESFGLKLIGADTAVKEPDVKEALKEMTNVRGKRIADMSARAADGIKQSIAVLIANHNQLEQKQGLTLSGLLQGLEKARAYIDEVNKLRAEN